MSTQSLSALNETLVRLTRSQKQHLASMIDECLSLSDEVSRICRGVGSIDDLVGIGGKLNENVAEMRALIKVPLELTPIGADGCPDQVWLGYARQFLVRTRGALAPLMREIEQPAHDEPEQYVTLDRAAAMVGKSKKTMARYVNKNGSDAPPPDVEGGGGYAHEWRWSVLRPWLEKVFGKKLPEKFPSRLDLI